MLILVRDEIDLESARGAKRDLAVSVLQTPEDGHRGIHQLGMLVLEVAAFEFSIASPQSFGSPSRAPLRG